MFKGRRRISCPMCGETTKEDVFPSLSRVDNKTDICPQCGIQEAIICLRHRRDSKDVVIDSLKAAYYDKSVFDKRAE